MAESKLQKQILDLIVAKGHYAINVIVASRSGVLDIVACINGRFVGIEVKLAYNVPSELQMRNLKKIRNGGGFAKTVYSFDEALDFIKAVETLTSKD